MQDVSENETIQFVMENSVQFWMRIAFFVPSLLLLLGTMEM